MPGALLCSGKTGKSPKFSPLDNLDAPHKWEVMIKAEL
jgi:hypothetical protein